MDLNNVMIEGQTKTNSKNLEKPLDVPMELQYHILNSTVRREKYNRTIWDNTRKGDQLIPLLVS